MPLRVVEATDIETLWDACASRFLAEVGDAPGPDGLQSHLWLTHRNLRDLLFERAWAQGHAGWLGPPVSFISQLPHRFGIRARPVGLLTRRRLLGRLAAAAGKRFARQSRDAAEGVIRGHMLDSLLSELLPEGVTPEQLGAALEALGGDAFARQRSDWVVTVYRRYLWALQARGEIDDRSINALVAARIDAGELRSAIGGATRLHVYGLYSARHRQRLLRALGAQGDVDVVLYATVESEAGELQDLAERVDRLPGTVPEAPFVQPAPDAAREVEWVAREVKRALHDGAAEPWQVAVIARSGQHDTRRVQQVLRRAGVPVTARVRTPLAEVAALRALSLLFRAAADGWGYQGLRAVLSHPYFDTGTDLRAFDYIATQWRVQGLDAWLQRLRQLRRQLDEPTRQRRLRGRGLYGDRVDADIAAFEALSPQLDRLTDDRSEADWLELTLSLLHEDFLGLRGRLCDPVDERWDVVRLDQRGVVQLRRLLQEWLQLDHPPEPLPVERWRVLLNRLLAAHELVLTTPMHKGVQVLEAHDAALIPFRRSFLIHANDGEFPRAPAVSTIISDEESRQLGQHGIHLPDRRRRQRRERALWNAVASHRSGASISYRTTGTGGGPLLASLMVPEHPAARELPRTRVPHLDPDAEDGAVSAAHADRLAVQHLAVAIRDELSSGKIEVGAESPPRIRQALVAAVAEAHRHRRGLRLAAAHPALRPNPWNGQLRDPEILQHLASRFGDQYRWSASALEAYGRCPFLFLLERVLYIRDPQEPTEETSALVFGSVAHRILERFYAQRLQDVPVAMTPAVEAELDRVVGAVFDEAEGSGDWLGAPLLWASTKRQIRRAVREFLVWELDYLHRKGEEPIVCEHRFGDEAPDGLVLQGNDLCGVSRSLRVRGRIDRVDRTGKRRVWHDVLDYKSSTVPTRSGYDDGSTMQAALYLRVWESLGNPARKARYRPIKKAGHPANGAEVKLDSEPYRNALAFAFSIPARVRAGLFEPVKSHGSRGWQFWDIGTEITRGRVVLPRGRSRFDE